MGKNAHFCNIYTNESLRNENAFIAAVCLQSTGNSHRKQTKKQHQQQNQEEWDLPALKSLLQNNLMVYSQNNHL